MATKDRLHLVYLPLTKAQRGAACKECNIKFSASPISDRAVYH